MSVRFPLHKLSVASVFFYTLFSVYTYAQEITKNSQKADLKQALENPEEVFGLDLSGKGLTTFPPEILQCKNLVVLNLSNNQLTQIPESISQLTKLGSLNLSNNLLTSVPSSIAELHDLEELNFSNNLLTTIPNPIWSLSNLVELDLKNNAAEIIRQEEVVAYTPESKQHKAKNHVRKVHTHSNKFLEILGVVGYGIFRVVGAIGWGLFELMF